MEIFENSDKSIQASLLKEIEKRNEVEINSAIKKIQKKIELRNQFNQQRDVILPDVLGLDIQKHEINDMNILELRDELSNQNLIYQVFFV